jgi:ATP synthase protein I
MAEPDPDRMIRQVAAKQQRMLRARTDKDGFWNSLSVLGVVGWSVVLPTLLGVALGVFLDHHWPGQIPWTITLLFMGLVLGCMNAWRQLKGDHR